MPKRTHIPEELYGSCSGGGIVLRTPKWADFDEWAALRRENRDYLTPWEPSWDEVGLNRSAYRQKLANFKRLIASDSAYPFFIFRADDDQLIGACNLTNVKRGAMQSAHIGYWTGERFTRQGFARAAVRTVLDFSFNGISLHRVNAAVRTDNAASINLLESIGFIQEGLARDFLKINGAWCDHLIYAKLRSDP